MIIGTFLIGNIVSFYDVILTLKLNHYLGLTVLNQHKQKDVTQHPSY